MKQEKWADALDRLNPDYITEAMPHRSAKRLKRGKERIMKQEFSIIKLTTGIVATAAVVALVAGSAVLISSMNRRVETQPGHSGSTAEGTTTAVTTTTTAPEEAAITTTLSTAAQPQEGTNFLGGTGALKSVGMSNGEGYTVLHDDEYWYTGKQRVPLGTIEPGVNEAEPLGEVEADRYSHLLSDGEQLYIVNANSLFTIDASGVTTPFYTYEGHSHVVYSTILNLGNAMSPDFATEDPWYYIGGYAGDTPDMEDSSTEGSYVAPSFGVFFQPATGKQMEVQNLFTKDNTPFCAPNEVRVCGNSVYALVGDGFTVSAIPHPDALMSDRVQLDWAQQYYHLPIHDEAYLADWTVNLDTVSYAFYDNGVCYAGRYWWKDGASEEKRLIIHEDGAWDGYVPLKAENITRVTAKYAGSDLAVLVLAKIDGEAVELNFRYDSDGLGSYSYYGTEEIRMSPEKLAFDDILAAEAGSLVWAEFDANGDLTNAHYARPLEEGSDTGMLSDMYPQP